MCQPHTADTPARCPRLAYLPRMFEDHDDASFSPSDDEHDNDDGPPAVFVSTLQGVPIRIVRLEDERAEPDGVCLASYIGPRLVARCAMPDAAIQHLLQMELFGEPVPLGLFAYEQEPGLQCRLYALFPKEKLAEATSADEPWRASVPSYESGGTLSDDDEIDEDEVPEGATQMGTVLLGNIVRFSRDRKHSDDLAAEALDILQKIINGGPLADADVKAIDDLLDSL
jgi:hypothetical protein